jgi:hypothetical protein
MQQQEITGLEFLLRVRRVVIGAIQPSNLLGGNKDKGS